MGEKTKIVYADYTFNPWRGCSKVSPGCDNCYAEKNRSVKLAGVKWGNGAARLVTAESGWKKPLVWNRKAEREGTRSRVLTSLCDVYDERAPVGAFVGFMRLMKRTPSLDWLVPTKRPQNVSAMWPNIVRNLWLGVSCENQEWYDKRASILLRLPVAGKRWLSLEPLLGPIDLADLAAWPGPMIDWVVVGGESGPRARECRVAWVRSIVEQCADQGVCCYVKQLGSHWAREEARLFGHRVDAKGGDPGQWLPDLRIRQLPTEVTNG